MEAGGAAGSGGAVAAVGVGGAAAAAGAATGVIRAVARVHLVLGLAAAAFALCVVTLQPQLKQQGSDCAATEADAVTMRTHGLLLLLSAGSQASAASVAAFAPEFWNHRFICWIFTAFAHALSVVTYFHLISVFDSVAAVAVGSCPGHLHAHRTEYIALGVLLSLPHWAFSLVGVVALVAPIVAPSL